ncbi:uncharacterized protein DUF2528 [Paucimonas lemoignei]|uniref:Uncharacterized protein DUF2528 n=1 Tax=Paucimonas lemoignei TaxID=29443 RepID=A0A4R3HWQ6_PAULE|nr:DUF2528 family protein [Paucimonas lemoignei]TCS35829.1 uncharacterized protein DUF2528 [Paucimonas lemoignei]
MANWSQYIMTYDDTGHQVEVAVSDAPETLAVMGEINSFWSGDKDRLAAANGDLTVAVLKMLCTRLLAATFSEINPFDDFVKGKVEGWPPLDGSYGIKLLHTDHFSLDGDVSISFGPYYVGLETPQ